MLACNVAKHLAAVLPKTVLWSHLPFGENRSEITGARLKRMGTQKGWADYLFVHDGGLLAIELKSATGRQSPAQVAFGDALTALGGMYIVCRSIDQVNAALALAGIHTRERVA